MANQYTSMLTGGLSDNTVKTMYDFAFDKVFTETCIMRQFADKRPVSVNGPGQTIVLNKTDWLSDASVTAAKTALNEELDVDSTKLPATVPVTLTVNEYGAAVTTTKKLRYFSFADVDEVAAMSVADHAARTHDSLIQDVFLTGTQIIRAAGRTSVGTVTSTDYLDSTRLAQTRTKLRRNVVPGYATGNLGPRYMGVAHPDVIHDLRRETGQGSWRQVIEYSGINGNQAFTGEFGEYEGIRFVDNARCYSATDGSASAKVYRSFVFGKQAIAERVVEEPSTVLGPVTDKLQRFRTLGWYSLLGWALYRNESLVVLQSSSSVANI